MFLWLLGILQPLTKVLTRYSRKANSCATIAFFSKIVDQSANPKVSSMFSVLTCQFFFQGTVIAILVIKRRLIVRTWANRMICPDWLARSVWGNWRTMLRSCWLWCRLRNFQILYCRQTCVGSDYFLDFVQLYVRRFFGSYTIQSPMYIFQDCMCLWYGYLCWILCCSFCLILLWLK